MRVNKPSLVRPELAHSRSFEDQMGVVTPRTIGQRTVDLSSDKIQGRKPPILAGGWKDDTAAPELARILHELGHVNDQTETGVAFDIDVSAILGGYTNASVSADTPTTTDLVNYSNVITRSVAWGTGVYDFSVLAGAMFSHSAAGTINFRWALDGAGGVVSTANQNTNREPYAGYEIISDLSPGSYTFQFQYKCDSAGTATARAPWMVILPARVG